MCSLNPISFHLKDFVINCCKSWLILLGRAGNYHLQRVLGSKSFNKCAYLHCLPEQVTTLLTRHNPAFCETEVVSEQRLGYPLILKIKCVWPSDKISREMGLTKLPKYLKFNVKDNFSVLSPSAHQCIRLWNLWVEDVPPSASDGNLWNVVLTVLLYLYDYGSN